MTATPPTPLLVPAAPPAQGKRAAAPADNPKAGSFAQQLARQRGAAADETRPAAGAPARPAGNAKPAKEPGAETPESAAAADPAASADPAAAAAAGAAAVQAQAQPQPQQPPPAALPAQALEIAAQAAQLQRPAPAAAGMADAGTPAASATPAPAAQAAAAQAAATPQAVAAALPAAAPASAPAPHAKAPAASAGPDARAAARDARAAPAPQLAAAGPGAPQHIDAQAAADADLALQLADNTPQPAGHGGASLHAAVTDTADGLAAAAGIAGRAPATSAPLLAPATPLALGVAVPVAATPAWGADLGRQLVVLSHDAARGQQTAELRLDPPDLGPLRVTLSVNDGVATASFVSAHAAVRHAVEAALPQLQQALAQAGLSLGQASVGEHGSQSGFDMQQQQGRGQGQGQGGGAQGEVAVALTPAASATATRGDSLVDTFA
ncbi:flagellar hook-length control protein FliK [Bordetella petrii]|uniref:flagellar hook-length control protein FliK n=1 Tax=Bordetella petrii TaxID=94624 RepID=UPI001A9761C8|nr:flagellar hook-length control protein FliK [Bordetella petrii]MBO1111086.1 flagellar hook-length control protein FliK [Bordetella petrii]